MRRSMEHGMKRSGFLMSVVGFLALGACAPGEVAVTIEDEVLDPAAGEMGRGGAPDIEIELLPYDRDEVFDSLEAAAAVPEPPIPADVLWGRSELSAARQEWSALVARWGSLRNQLEEINGRLQQMSRGESAYAELFNEFTDREAEYERVNQARLRAFSRMTGLQEGLAAQMEDIRIQRELWAEEAFKDAALVIERKVSAAGREVLADTTTAEGLAHFRSVKPGVWWVHARLQRPFVELYWNVRVEVKGGEVTELLLRPEDAEERPRL